MITDNNQIIGVKEIPLDIVQNCSLCRCIPASILFIFKCRDPNFSIEQDALFNKLSGSLNFEGAKNNLSCYFPLDYVGFSLEEYKNVEDQFNAWKEYVIEQLLLNNPVAVCFKESDISHCKVIFQNESDTFKIFNPGSPDSENYLFKKIVDSYCHYEDCPNRYVLGGTIYSAIETYTFDELFKDLVNDKLQMQVLAIKLDQPDLI